MSDTLRKREMSARVAELLGCPKSGGELALNAVLQSITDAIRNGDRVVLTGFGTFETRDVRARKVRPVRGANRGELIEVPAHRAVRFRAGKTLRQVAGQERT